MKTDPHLILFDWDRTISDVEGPTNELLRQTFARNDNEEGYTPFMRLFRAPVNQGRKVRDRLEDILGERIGGKYYEAFLDIKKHSLAKPQVFAGLEEQIMKIRNTQNVILGIVTNKNTGDVYEEEHDCVKDSFSFIIGGDGIAQSDLKPSGHLVNMAIEKAQTAISDIIMIGDTSHDINALGNSSFTCRKNGILSFWGISEEERILQKERVDVARINSLHEVSDISKLSDTVDSILHI